MMYGYGAGLGGGSSLGFLTWIVLFADLIMLGIWLWQQISKK